MNESSVSGPLETKLETVYRTEISPLIKSIISTCEQHGISFVAAFQLDSDENGHVFVTMAIEGKDPSDSMTVMAHMANALTFGGITDDGDASVS